MPHLESKIVDPATGLTVPRGAAGELCTRGHTVMLGYWDDPARTAEREGAEPLTAEAVKAFCADKLAHHKIPRYVHVVDSFPMTVTGKVRKVEMREVTVEIIGLHAAAGVRHA